MIKAQIDSLALTPNPIVLENLPPPHVYDLHHVFHQIFIIHQIKMLPMEEDFEDRLDKLIEKLTPEKLNRALNAFLMHLDKYSPNKYQLYFNLLDALELSRTTPSPINPGPSPAASITAPSKQTLKPALKKKTTARGLKWRLDPRWDKLTPCAIAVFMVLCLRAIWPKKLTSFPWAFGGVGTWTKEEGMKPGSLCRQSGYGQSPVRRALRQLQGKGMIKKIFRAYEGQGVSKFYVFFTPEMSKAFTAIAKNRIRILSQKKRASRMS